MTENITATTSLTFAASRLEDFKSKIAKINGKIKRAGGTDVYHPTYTSEWRNEVTKTGLTVAIEYVTATWEAKRISLGRFTFVASLVPEEAGMTVHTAPGQSLEGWTRPAADDQTCQHCNTVRNRSRMYVVRDDTDGSLIQLGHNCIALYTGMEPKGLWQLTVDEDLEDWAHGPSSDGGGGGSFAPYLVINEVLGLAYALSDQGRAYISRAKAQEWNKDSTAQQVNIAVNGLFPSAAEAQRYGGDVARERERYLDAIADGKEYAADEKLIAGIRAAAETLSAGTDYADNVAIILAAESGIVSPRNMGTLASLVSVYRRNLERDAERKAAASTAVQGFVADVGVRVKNLTLTLTTVKTWEGDYGTTTFIVGRDEAGRIVVWKASRYLDLNPGDTLHLSAATVKEHGNFNGVDQTIVTRAKIAE